MWISTEEDYQDLFKRISLKYRDSQVITIFDYLPEVGSTNTWIKEFFASGTTREDWHVVFTRHQTAGRGTRGRNWVSQPGLDAAVTCTMALRTGIPDPRISLAFGAATALVVEEVSGCPAGIKWPNDVLLKLPEETGGHWAKIAGILIETFNAREDYRDLIVGIGVNCNSRAVGFPTDLRDKITTMCDAAGRPIDVCDFLEKLIDRMMLVMYDIRDEDISQLLEEWESRDRTGGTKYFLNRDMQKTEVTARRVDMETGGLIVADSMGSEYLVTSYTELSAPGEDV